MRAPRQTRHRDRVRLPPPLLTLWHGGVAMGISSSHSQGYTRKQWVVLSTRLCRPKRRGWRAYMTWTVRGDASGSSKTARHEPRLAPLCPSAARGLPAVPRRRRRVDAFMATRPSGREVDIKQHVVGSRPRTARILLDGLVGRTDVRAQRSSTCPVASARRGSSLHLRGGPGFQATGPGAICAAAADHGCAHNWKGGPADDQRT